MTALVLKYAIVFVVGVLLLGMVLWGRRRPNRAKGHPGRLRLPKFVAVIGWALFVVGFLMGLVAFTSRYTEDLNPMRIASASITLGGLVFLMMYRNWYIAPEADAVHFRTIFGNEKTIAYADIANWRTTTSNGQPRLTVRSNSGDKLVVNPLLYDMTPLFAAIEFKERTGRWPLRGEAR